MPTERRQHARLNAQQGAIWRRIGHRISNPAVEGSNPSGSVSLRRIRVDQPVDAFHPCPCPTMPALARGRALSPSPRLCKASGERAYLHRGPLTSKGGGFGLATFW